MNDDTVDNFENELREQFEASTADVAGHEDWADLTHRISARARRRNRVLSAAAAVVVIGSLGGGIGVALSSQRSDDSAATAAIAADADGPRLSTESGGSAATDAPKVVEQREAADFDANDSGAGTATAEAPPEALSEAPATSGEGGGIRTTARVAGRISLTTWACASGFTVDAASPDTVARLIIGPAATSGATPSAVAIVDGVGRAQVLAVVAVYPVAGAVSVRATFPDGTVDTAPVAGPDPALDAPGQSTALLAALPTTLAAQGPYGVGSPVAIDLLDADGNVVATTSAVLAAAADQPPAC